MLDKVEKAYNSNHFELLLQLKELYNYILDEIIELINFYNCKTPLEIFCLFNLINDFFINKNELFKQLYNKDLINFSRELEKPDIMGVQVLINGGVCRHRSAMLSDIYKKIGIDSVKLSGISETILNFHYNNSNNKQISDMFYVQNMLKRISEGAKLEDFKSQLKKRKISYQAKEVHDDYYFSSQRKMPNHAIVMVGQDKRYYLDPTNNVTYYKTDGDIITLRNSLGIYFFHDIRVQKFLYELPKSFDETYNRILEKAGAEESETVRNIKEIYSYLKSIKTEIEEFVKDNNESIEHIRGISLALTQDSNKNKKL